MKIMAELKHSRHELENPDKLVANFYHWRMEYEEMKAKIDKQKKELEFKELQLLMATSNSNLLQNETSQLSFSVHELHDTIQKLMHFEVENIELVKKMTQIEVKMLNMEQEHERKLQSAQAQIIELRDNHVTELANLKKQFELNAQANNEDYKKIIYEKELEIIHHIEHMKRLEKEFNEKIIKTKFEYDHKLMKTQEQAKSIKSVPKVTISTHASAGIDILRKKMQNMQHMHNLETSELKAKLAELQDKVQSYEPLSSSEENQRSAHHNHTLKRRKK